MAVRTDLISFHERLEDFFERDRDFFRGGDFSPELESSSEPDEDGSGVSAEPDAALGGGGVVIGD